MKASSIHELKQELNTMAPAQLKELCLRLARFKKENKELLTYLLFEAQDEQEYIENIKQQINEQFQELNLSNLYFVKKGLRKILRTANKYCRYSGLKQTEIELLLYFSTKLKKSGIPIQKNKMINNLYQSQIKKIKTVLTTLHEDLQYDYLKELEALQYPST